MKLEEIQAAFEEWKDNCTSAGKYNCYHVDEEEFCEGITVGAEWQKKRIIERLKSVESYPDFIDAIAELEGETDGN